MILLKVAVSALLITWLLKRIGPATLVDQFAHLNGHWLGVGMAVFVASNVLGALQWHVLLQQRQVGLSWRQVLAYYHIGLFFNNFLIGYVGGDAFRIYDVHNHSGDLTGAVSTVFLDRFLGFFALTSMAMVMALIWFNSLAFLRAVIGIAIVLTGWLFALVFLFNERLARRFFWLFKLVSPRALHNRLRELYYGIHAFRHQHRLLAGLFVLSLAIQALRILTHYYAARALGVDLPIVLFFVFVPIIALISSLPISVGGIGVREQSGVALFAQAGIASAQVTAFEMLAYLIGIVASLPGGLIFMVRSERKKSVVLE